MRQTPPSQKPPFTPPVQGLTLKRNVDAMQYVYAFRELGCIAHSCEQVGWVGS